MCRVFSWKFQLNAQYPFKIQLKIRSVLAIKQCRLERERKQQKLKRKNWIPNWKHFIVESVNSVQFVCLFSFYMMRKIHPNTFDIRNTVNVNGSVYNEWLKPFHWTRSISRAKQKKHTIRTPSKVKLPIDQSQCAYTIRTKNIYSYLLKPRFN